MRTKEEVLDGIDESLFNDLCYLDFRVWVERVFGEQIDSDFKLKDFHIEWMNLAHNNPCLMLQAARQHAKSTFLGKLYPLWLAYYKPKAQILITASEESQSIKIIEEIKELIENNEFLLPLKPENPETWGKKGITLSNGSKFIAKAFTTKVKGLSLDYVFLDEIQDIKDREVFWKGISPTVSNKNGKIVAVGVSDNPGDMVEELSNTEGYVSVRYPAVIDGKPIWPERFDMEKLNLIRKRDGENTFQTQYMLNPRAANEDAVFPHDWIYNCFDKNAVFHKRPRHKDSIVTIGADFAISDSPRADFDAYVIVEKHSGKTEILHGERHHGTHPEVKKERLRQLNEMFKPTVINVDPSHVGAHIAKDLLNEGLPIQEGAFYSKERKNMLVTLQMLMQPDRNGTSSLVIPRNRQDMETAAFTDNLLEELIGFKIEKSEKTKLETYASKARHDDAVMALALACKASADQQEFFGMMEFA